MSKYEKNVTEDKVFYLSNGQVIRNLKELNEVIGNLSDDVFFHHVSSEKNDFANWVRDVIGEKALATRILKAGTPVMMKDVLKGLFEKKAPVVKPAAKAAAKPATKAATPKKAAVVKKPVAKTGGKKKA